jgi:uncharacterized protein (TIGR04255 family)
MTENAPPLPHIPERHYERPPVVEALCELYFAGSQWDATVPGLFYERVRGEYPQKSELAQGGVELQFAPGQAEARPIVAEPRLRFARTDNSRLLQLGRDLLVVNQLLPYTRYEEWRDVVLAALSHYRELAAPAGVDRLGVRYINKIWVPTGLHGITRLEDYFLVYPHVPEDLLGHHGPFALQVMMRPVCPNHHLVMNLGVGPPERPGTFTILLDLYDVMNLQRRDVFDQAPRLLDEAHADIINTFENTITGKARQLFGEVKHE